ncbi:MAG TPA: DUF5678 domain-containing protein [Chloroflexota bacterium]|nr:DUF5678 domain-containing protein [Chloroflexota bacterium]HUM69691.1 DUF5678 domain-containing protein [Chloroflexota bacterium]
MSGGIQLTMSQQLYDRAQRVALSQQKAITDVVAEVLDQGLPKATEDSGREREKTAFHRLHPSLLQQFPEEYVAIYEGKLIDHDADRVALLERIEATYPDVFVLVRPVKLEPEIVYRHISFRSG